MNVPARGRPGLQDVLAGAWVVRVPLHLTFRGVNAREAMLIEGPAGWGEFAPFPEYDDAESARWLAAAVEAAWDGWPEPVRTTVPVNATVPAVTADRVGEVLARYDGCRTVKVKVAQAGQLLADDLSRVAAVRDLLGATGRIRVDANGAWSLEDAHRALAALSAYDIEYAEQPCASVHDLARLRVALARDGVEVPVAADESIRRAEDPLLVRDLEAADIVVVKVAPLGGVRSALRIAAEVGLPTVVSSALDTSVGMRAGAALAAALPRLDHACGLGTVELLSGDVSRGRYVPVGGELDLRSVVADPELLGRWAAEVSPDRARWWRERLARCWALLGDR